MESGDFIQLADDTPVGFVQALQPALSPPYWTSAFLHEDNAETTDRIQATAVEQAGAASRQQGTTISGVVARPRGCLPPSQERRLSKQTDSKARATFNNFYKTKICPWLLRGTCKWGITCNYAHELCELRACIDLTKTRMCPQLSRYGICQQPQCRFAHDLKELRATDEFFKTEMCGFVQRNLPCPLEGGCRYAHSQEELRPRPTPLYHVHDISDSPGSTKASISSQNLLECRAQPPVLQPGFAQPVQPLRQQLVQLQQQQLLLQQSRSAFASTLGSVAQSHMSYQDGVATHLASPSGVVVALHSQQQPAYGKSKRKQQLPQPKKPPSPGSPMVPSNVLMLARIPAAADGPPISLDDTGTQAFLQCNNRSHQRRSRKGQIISLPPLHQVQQLPVDIQVSDSLGAMAAPSAQSCFSSLGKEHHMRALLASAEAISGGTANLCVPPPGLFSRHNDTGALLLQHANNIYIGTGDDPWKYVRGGTENATGGSASGGVLYPEIPACESSVGSARGFHDHHVEANCDVVSSNRLLDGVENLDIESLGVVLQVATRLLEEKQNIPDAANKMGGNEEMR